MHEPIDVIATYQMPEENSKKKQQDYYFKYNNTMAKVKPIRFKYKDNAINVDKILRTYEERNNGEKVLGYRCYYRQLVFILTASFYICTTYIRLYHTI